jgi:hypothetical protein
MKNRLIAASIVCTFVFGFASFATAHEVYQDVLKEQYMLKSFSCKTCHPDGDDRKLRTPFADRIADVMKKKGLSEKFAEATAKDEAAKKQDPESVTKDKGAVADFNKMVAKEFAVDFKLVAQQKMAIDDIIKEGLFNGARLDTKAIEAAKAAEANK